MFKRFAGMRLKKVFLTLCLLLTAFTAAAKEITMSVDAPRVTAVGAPFRIEFTLNGRPDSFTAPDFEGFDVVAGPSTSQSTSISIINGKTERMSSFIYTYVLVALSEGNQTIGAATAVKGKETVSTEPLMIEVVKESGGGAAVTTGQQQGSTTQAAAGQSIAPDDILLLVTPNRHTVYEGEPIIVRVKLLSRAQLVNSTPVKMPAFEGFWTQEIPLKQDEGWTREVYNDKIYESMLIREYILFPQKKGSITIEPMTMDFTVRLELPQTTQSNNIFDAFFGGAAPYQDVRKRVSSQKSVINVKPFEQKAPASYTGAVGTFTVTSELSSDIISANNSGNIKITVKGSGNLPLVNEPDVKLPSSFEAYKVKTSEDIKTSVNGVTGSKTFEYPFIARATGTYTIDPVEFSYFDTGRKQFVTLRTQPMKIAVTADTTRNSGNGGTTIITGITKDELKILGDDIRFIKTGGPNLHKTGSFFVTSPWYIAIILIMLLVFVLSVVYFRKRIKASRDITGQRNKKASKVALSRLKEAKKSMNEGNKTMFYQNMLKAMWGYMGDKLNIPNSKLTKDAIENKMAEKGVSEEIIKEYKEIISDCEFAQYAPSGSIDMHNVYDKAVKVISSLENNL